MVVFQWRLRQSGSDGRRSSLFLNTTTLPKIGRFWKRTELIEAGKTFEEASRTVEQICQHALYYVHPADEPHLINGVRTEFLEIIEDLPDIDIIIVPLGAGSEAAAAITVLKTIRPTIEVIAVQAKNSPAAYNS